MTATEKIDAQYLKDHFGLTVESVFVPWSKSRSFDPAIGQDVSRKNLNWQVTLKHEGRNVLTTDYSAGIAHAPYYNKAKGHKWSMHNAERFEIEVEGGFEARESDMLMKSSIPILPDAEGVVYSLVMESDALDHPTYESWASEYGYDEDSRKGEATYRACLGIALKLRAALGDRKLEVLRERFQDF